MPERPIIFSADMVRAILEGRKTQTRRVAKPQPNIKDWELIRWSRHGAVHDAVLCVDRLEQAKCPFGQPGDRLMPLLPMPGYDERYGIDLDGNPWSRAKGDWRQMKVSANSKGYATITPARQGRYRTALLHRLVCEAFYGPPAEKQQCRHLNGRRLDNSPDNLDWGSQAENWQDRKFHGNGIHEDHHSAKLNMDAAHAIRGPLKAEYSQREIADLYGVSQSVINDIQAGRIWREQLSPLPPNHLRWASRIDLEITAVRVERLQDISEEDARAEGANQSRCGQYGDEPLYSHRTGFVRLWNSIHGPDAWGQNPWVWVLEFERVR